MPSLLGEPNLVPIKPAIHQVVSVLEYLYFSSADAKADWPEFVLGPNATPEDIAGELTSFDSLPDPTAVFDQIWVAYDLAIDHGIPTVWCCKNHHPITALILGICMTSGLFPRDIMESFINEQGLINLSNAVDEAKAAPLIMFDASAKESFLLLLAKLTTVDAGTVIVCDWCLEPDEQAFVYLTAGRVNVRVVWPKK